MGRYDDDDSEEGDGNFFKGKANMKKMKKVATGTVGSATKLAKGAAGGAKKVVVGMPGNAKKVATGMPGNAKKFAASSAGHVRKASTVTVSRTVKAVGGAGRDIRKVSGSVKKRVKRKKSRSRGRSRSPSGEGRRSKPPVTKTGKIKGLWNAVRGRSTSSQRKRKDRYGDEEMDTLSPLPAAVSDFPGIALGSAIDKISGNGMQNGLGDSSGGRGSDREYSQKEELQRRNESAMFSWLIHSSIFVKHCDLAFDIVDADGNGNVDEVELYAGLLLIHLKLGSILGPAACKPLSRPRCSAMFRTFDSTGSGGLDREEFRRVMMVLFSNVFARVLVQYTLTILVVPLIAKNVLHLLSWDSQGFWDYWTKPKGLGEELTLDDYMDWTVSSIPSRKRTFVTGVYYFFRIGSDSFWETFPLTFLTVILGIVIAPFVLYYFDDMFQVAVDWNETRKARMR